MLPVLAVSAYAAPISLLAQGFGQNHVVIHDFDWKVRSTEHFDIHYYEQSAPWVEDTAKDLEHAFSDHETRLGVTIHERLPLFLYANVDDMQQSNIVQVGDGTGGVTEPYKNRFIVYNDGSEQWLDDVLSHELVHEFQFEVLYGGFWRSARILKGFIYPLWMMEGMAEYGTPGLDDATQEIYVRDAATSGGLIPLWKLEHFSHLKPHQVTLAYKSGATAMEFLATQYGPEKVGQMLKLFESHFESSSVLEDLIGTDLFGFDRKWREYLEEKYRRVVKEERLQEPVEYGVALTTSPGEIPEFNSSPVFTPDGQQMAYFSTQDGFDPILVLKDLRTNTQERLVTHPYTRIEFIPLGNFDHISRVLAISPDGKTLAFAAQKNHSEYLYFYDLAKRKLHRRSMPGFMALNEPAFSPDGRRVAFSGMKNGITDIYLLDLKSGFVSQVTDDPQDDQSPNFSPDGRDIVYSSEVNVPDYAPMPYQRRLYRVRLADRYQERLLDIQGAARDPVYSADGRRIVFALEKGDFEDIYELDLESNTVRRLTRTKGGSFCPIYIPGRDDIAFASFRKGNIHIYEGDRQRLLSEALNLRESAAVAKTESPQAEGKGTLASEGAPVAGATASSSTILAPNEISTSSSGFHELPGMETYKAEDFLKVSTLPVVQTSTASVVSPERPFHDSASVDLFLPAFFYSSLGGFFWTSYGQASDMLGNHQVVGLLSYNSGAGYLNYQTAYSYDRFRPQVSLALQGLTYRNVFDPNLGENSNNAVYQEFLTVAYPLDRYHRVEFAGGVATQNLQYPDDPTSNFRSDSRLGAVAFVRDTIDGRYLVATRGSRIRLQYASAAPVLGGHYRYQTVSGEGHQYIELGDLSAIALRGVVAGTWESNEQQFILGGIGGVRGYARSVSDNVGNQMALATAELRFPLISNLDYYMWYIFPDFYFKMISMALFTDAGYVTQGIGNVHGAHVESIRQSYGIGLRIHTFLLQEFPLLVQFDYAQRTTSNGGIFYVYLGPTF